MLKVPPEMTTLSPLNIVKVRGMLARGLQQYIATPFASWPYGYGRTQPMLLLPSSSAGKIDETNLGS